METFDIIKNPILVQIPDDKKLEVYERWEKLKHKTHKVYKKNYGERIFDVAIQIYNKKIERTINKEKLFRKIIENEDTYQEICNFFEIVEKLFKIMDEISKDKYARLINNTSRICLSYEIYMWYLLPIFYIKKSIDTNVLKLITKYYFRNLQFKTRNFNNLCYSNEFISITNQFIADNTYDYYGKLLNCLQKNKDFCVEKSRYISDTGKNGYKNQPMQLIYLCF